MTLQNRRPLIVLSLMAAIFMIALEATIIATAMPQIVGDIGGFAYYSWAFTAFLLTQTATTVVFGKLSDMFGRRPTILVGITIFLAASVLCGFAWSMASLIAFRFLQGLGAGGIQPVAMTIIGDLFPAEERGKVQGAISSVWATSAILGPVAGAAIVEQLSWAWVFWINVPIGIAAAIGLLLTYREEVVPRRQSIDYLGAILFCLSVLAMLVAITEAGTSPGFALACALVFVASTAALVWQERRAADPMIPFGLWKRPLIASCNLTIAIAGFALIGITTMMPLYVQGVLGASPLAAGMALTMLAVGWPFSSFLSGRLFRRYGIVQTTRMGSLAFPLGALMMLFLPFQGSLILAGLGSFTMGFGMGLINIGCVVLVQNSVDWSLRGSATASNLFARSLGNALGATVLGAILNYGILYLSSPEIGRQLASVLDEQGGLAEVSAEPALTSLLGAALQGTFVAMSVLALIAVFAAWRIPNQTVPSAAR